MTSSSIVGAQRRSLSRERSQICPIRVRATQASFGHHATFAYVENLDSTIAALKAAGLRFRNDVEAGPGGTQILVEDPDGNVVELHEAPR